uniref:Cytochrome P450 CYP12A2c n=1 Tax=Cydia pomonella TaxID=82600 RepID=A0A346II24_CYDPO|nr:cytochrome P450 CYP12A2c [Cydia pomonella]
MRQPKTDRPGALERGEPTPNNGKWNAVTSTDAETQNLRPWKEIPGPTSLPIIGSLFSFLPGGKLYGYKGVKLSERLYQLYGPIVRFDGVFWWTGYDSIISSRSDRTCASF